MRISTEPNSWPTKSSKNAPRPVSRHPVGQALCILAFIAHRRGQDDAALAFLHDAVALYRDLDDPWQLAGLLVELAVQEAVGRGDEALQTLAESSRLDEQIGRRSERVLRLAIAAVAHLADGDRVMAVSALGAYDADVPVDVRGWQGRPRVKNIEWVTGAVEGGQVSAGRRRGGRGRDRRAWQEPR